MQSVCTTEIAHSRSSFFPNCTVPKVCLCKASSVFTGNICSGTALVCSMGTLFFPMHETPYFHVAHSSSSIFTFMETGKWPEAVLFLSVPTEYLITLDPGLCPERDGIHYSALSQNVTLTTKSSHECHLNSSAASWARVKQST